MEIGKEKTNGQVNPLASILQYTLYKFNFGRSKINLAAFHSPFPAALKFSTTVNIQNPDRPDFEWSFFGHFFSPVFKWSAILF
jgi:hypothetical protein